MKPLRGWTERTLAHLARHDYDELVHRFRTGPPLLSVMRLPGAQSALSTFEHFVHHEDVRRAAPETERRQLPARDQGVLWQQLSARARWYVRESPVAVRLVAPDLGTIEVGRDDAEELTLTGLPSELVMHLHGRREHADVDVGGSDHARNAWANHALRG